MERAILSAPVVPPRAAGLPATVVVPVTNFSHDGTPSYYLPTYAPGAMALADATMVSVAGSDERNGVDVRAQLISAGTIKGTLSTPLDPGVTVQLWLIGDDPSAESPHGSQARVSPDGTFTFFAVAPGAYTIFAQTVAVHPQMTFVNGQPVPQPPPVLTEAQKMWSMTRVKLGDGATVQVAVSLQASRSISGIVVFDTKERPDLTRSTMTVRANATTSSQMYVPYGSLRGVVGPDGRFTISGVPAGRYMLGLDGGGSLKSAIVSGQDTLDFPFQFAGDHDVTDAVLTVSDRAAAFSAPSRVRPEAASMMPSRKPGSAFSRAITWPSARSTTWM